VERERRREGRRVVKWKRCGVFIAQSPKLCPNISNELHWIAVDVNGKRRRHCIVDRSSARRQQLLTQRRRRPSWAIHRLTGAFYRQREVFTCTDEPATMMKIIVLTSTVSLHASCAACRRVSSGSNIKIPYDTMNTVIGAEFWKLLWVRISSSLHFLPSLPSFISQFPSLPSSRTPNDIWFIWRWIASYEHRRRSGWNSGGSMASAEGGSVPSGVRYGEGCPLSSRLGHLGERHELPQRGRGAEPQPKTDFGVFWRPQNASFYLCDKNLRRTVCISVPYSKFWGTYLPSPVIYAHADKRYFWPPARRRGI